MPKRQDDDQPLLPFPLTPVSNGEWCPLPITDRQRALERLVIEETGARARWHGLTRAQFLKTAAATLTTFMCINKVYGYDQSGDNAMLPVKKEHCDDLDAARELLDRKQTFVMDVQQHHVDLERFGDTGSFFCFLDFIKAPGTVCPESIGQLAYIREVFINSETTVGVISGLPAGVPLGPAQMAATRDLVNQLAGSERALSQAVCDPKANPNDPQQASTAIEQMEHQVRELGGRALKCYTYSYNGWRLDDVDGTRMLEEATRLGITLVNTHKGLPAIFAPGSPETVRTTDYPQALKNFPKMNFCAYHSGYFQGDTHPEGKTEITEFIEMLEALPKKDRKRMHAEIGSTFGITFTADQGDQGFRTAHLLGQLLKTLGPRNILWGTDSVWWGSPQFLIDGFKMLQIPASLQEQFGYPPLTEKAKRKILGENAARLYKVKKKAERCTIPPDALEQVQIAQGGPRGGMTNRWYGPQTRRGFLSLARGEWRPRV
jgi:hypothetical protein